MSNDCQEQLADFPLLGDQSDVVWNYFQLGFWSNWGSPKISALFGSIMYWGLLMGAHTFTWGNQSTASEWELEVELQAQRFLIAKYP